MLGNQAHGREAFFVHFPILVGEGGRVGVRMVGSGWAGVSGGQDGKGRKRTEARQVTDAGADQGVFGSVRIRYLEKGRGWDAALQVGFYGRQVNAVWAGREGMGCAGANCKGNDGTGRKGKYWAYK